MTEKKIKVLTISDIPISVSGVALQTRIAIDALLESGKFEVISIGGAMKHKSYQPMKTEEWGDDWVIYPVDQFGSPEIVRSLIRSHKPDMLWFMTDPRFFEWLWALEDEIRPLMPMVYYHVWDNYPFPQYNFPFYASNDLIATISKTTDDVVKNVAPEVWTEYLPHCIDDKIFKPLPEAEVKKARDGNFGENSDKLIFFWNNRNARRKLGGSIIVWFKQFLDRVGHDKAMLLMHTDPTDMNGPNLNMILDDHGLNSGQVKFSTTKLPPKDLAALYNMVDCTINVSDAEGFGLATLESLSCGTPILVNLTGGLKDQISDGKNDFGFKLEPVSKSIVGSQQVPYIYEDRVSDKEFVDMLEKIYNTPREELKKMGLDGREYVLKSFNYDKIRKRWPELLSEVHEKFGSWENRKGYKTWEIKEIL